MGRAAWLPPKQPLFRGRGSRVSWRLCDDAGGLPWRPGGGRDFRSEVWKAETSTVLYLGPLADDVDTDAKADQVRSKGLAAAEGRMNTTLSIL